MVELTALIGLDNWRKISELIPGALPVLKNDISVLLQIDNLSLNQKRAGLFAGVVPPIHKIQVDPVPAPFEM